MPTWSKKEAKQIMAQFGATVTYGGDKTTTLSCFGKTLL